jgi:hypothetical protein
MPTYHVIEGNAHLPAYWITGEDTSGAPLAIQIHAQDKEAARKQAESGKRLPKSVRFRTITNVELIVS